jgi:hypothetical protein
MLMNLQWYYRILMFPNIIDQPLVLQKYLNVSDWLGWQQILHILENSPPKLSTSQYRSKSPASWAQMEILQWSKLSIKSPCLWACHWACTCPHAEFWAILKVTHYFYSLCFLQICSWIVFLVIIIIIIIKILLPVSSYIHIFCCCWMYRSSSSSSCCSCSCWCFWSVSNGDSNCQVHFLAGDLCVGLVFFPNFF